MEDTLEETRKALDGEATAESKDAIVELVSKHKKNAEESLARMPRKEREPRAVSDDDEMLSDSADRVEVTKKSGAAVKKKPTRKATVSNVKARGAKSKVSEKSYAESDLEESDVNDEAPYVRGARGSAAALKVIFFVIHCRR